jgi:phenylalanyl-tRNA synthetase alpha chain
VNEQANTDPGQALERLDRLAQEAEREVLQAISPNEIEELRVRYLGRKAELTQILRSLPSLPAEERAAIGKRGNEVRRALEELIAERGDALGSRALEERLGT